MNPYVCGGMVLAGVAALRGGQGFGEEVPRDRRTDATEARRAIDAHYATASDHERVPESSELYAEDAVLEFPQGGERIRGKANIVAFRSAYPARVEFRMRRTIGSGDLWVNEGVITYDGDRPHHFVGIMEFREGRVVRETIYFGEPWTPPAWRARWVEPLE
jgi:hypothetical protein